MWKFTRILGFSRWHTNTHKSIENKSRKVVCPQVLVTGSSHEKKNFSDQNHHQREKENFNKENQRFWNCSHFQFLFSKSCLLETAGWLGTVTVLCFNFHRKHYFEFLFKNERPEHHCLFSKNVLAMAKDSVAKGRKTQGEIMEGSQLKVSNSDESKSLHVDGGSNFTEDLKKKTPQYLAAIHNSAGLACLDSNNKKAFHCFQKAAHLGSTQGFYNLGLCYELGKGTRVNLTRAAFCYRRAAMKGHGLASFNLAIYFLKGLGGLPVDTETAKLLLAEASKKDIPEAQVYIGLLYLEEEKWSSAHEIFAKLSKNNIPDGKYYLGLCYENGWGVDKDMKMAVDLYSQTALQGHSKSILNLSKCYEEGLGGCDTDLDFAMTLSQMLVDQGDEEGRAALMRQKLKKEQLGINDFPQLKLPSLNGVKTGMRTSSSVPEFPVASRSYAKYQPTSIISSYLDLITSYSSMETKRMKQTFYLADNECNLSHSYVSCVPS